MDEPDEDCDKGDRTFTLRWLFATIGCLALAALIFPWGDPKCCMGCSNPPKQVTQKTYGKGVGISVIHSYHICGECDFEPPEHPPTKPDSESYWLPTHHYGRTPIVITRTAFSALLMLAGCWGGFVLFCGVAFDSKKRKAERKAAQERYFARLESSQATSSDSY